MSGTGKPFDQEERETLRSLHADNWTDGRIARAMRRCRRTIIRQREAMGLSAVEHPAKRDRLGDRLIRASYIQRMRTIRQAVRDG